MCFTTVYTSFNDPRLRNYKQRKRSEMTLAFKKYVNMFKRYSVEDRLITTQITTFLIKKSK